MIQDEFINQLDALLNEYCTANPEYHNLHYERNIIQVNTPNVQQGVKVVISTYLYRKENSV